ncbi:hypothetical protein E1264_26485 [Actinomadura sp. KC216]|uniref:DUF6461 domain-containing protein n=1 Tax=Actinomadura sp. KC216 TaxID=2530370 RepID=UPI00104E266A|nr:DUF6461 domain-containing protein [Actinomadura sp. KC216]TDB83936.1 hypothetical protein E1264_26485 [Actinomadura sp. KC216]
MAGPGPERIEHYVRLLDHLERTSVYCPENLCWTVIRPHRPGLAVHDVVRRLGGDPEALTTRRPADVDYEDDEVFLEQRGDAVIIVAYGTATAEPEALRLLSRDATVHSLFWLINNFSLLSYLVDGELFTEVETLVPANRQGTDPEALTDHLGPLCDLRSSVVAGTLAGPAPDWETAMATLESLTGESLDAGWFARPQTYAKVNPG